MSNSKLPDAILRVIVSEFVAISSAAFFITQERSCSCERLLGWKRVAISRKIYSGVSWSKVVTLLLKRMENEGSAGDSFGVPAAIRHPVLRVGERLMSRWRLPDVK